MRRILWTAIVGAALMATGSPARAQFGAAPSSYAYSSYFGAPGYYGVGFGVPSLGTPRTYSVFSSPYGAGYGYGYAPYTYLPGAFGVGMWRPGFMSPGYLYGASYYGTYRVPYQSASGYGSGWGPSLGYYAPGFGPPAYYGW